MRDTVSGTGQATRTLVVSVLTIALAAAAHVAAGGQAPDFFALTVAALVTVGPAVWMGRSQSGVVATTFVLGVLQVVLHQAFMIADSATGLVASGHAGMTVTPAYPMAGMASHSTSIGMVIGHAIALVVTSALLWRGDRAARAVARLLRPRALPEVLMPSRVRVVVVRRPITEPYDTRIESVIRRRGPPQATLRAA